MSFLKLNSLLFRNIFSFALRPAKPGSPKQVPFQFWDITRGDRVMVRSGDDKGKIGRVTRVFRKTNRVVVNGVNKKMKFERKL